MACLASSARAGTFSIEDGGRVRLFDRATNEGPAVVLYERGAPRNAFTRRQVTARILVRVADGVDAAALASSVGAGYGKRIAFAPKYHVVTARNAEEALALAKRLQSTPGVLSAQPLLARQQA
ncbi:MAG TPA: hypothetical protein VIH35_08495, partial [Kiritimatiellia bacterium]